MDIILFLFVVAAATVTVQGHLRKMIDFMLQIQSGLVPKMWFPTSVSNADDISQELLTLLNRPFHLLCPYNLHEFPINIT